MISITITNNAKSGQKNLHYKELVNVEKNGANEFAKNIYRNYINANEVNEV